MSVPIIAEALGALLEHEAFSDQCTFWRRRNFADAIWSRLEASRSFPRALHVVLRNRSVDRRHQIVVVVLITLIAPGLLLGFVVDGGRVTLRLRALFQEPSVVVGLSCRGGAFANSVFL